MFPKVVMDRIGCSLIVVPEIGRSEGNTKNEWASGQGAARDNADCRAVVSARSKRVTPQGVILKMKGSTAAANHPVADQSNAICPRSVSGTKSRSAPVLIRSPAAPLFAVHLGALQDPRAYERESNL
jgi:hypothetical protein